jgi:hypothetical protein
MIWHFVDAKHLSISLPSEILPVISTTLILARMNGPEENKAFGVSNGISGPLGYRANVIY